MLTLAYKMGQTYPRKSGLVMWLGIVVGIDLISWPDQSKISQNHASTCQIWFALNQQLLIQGLKLQQNSNFKSWKRGPGECRPSHLIPPFLSLHLTSCSNPIFQFPGGERSEVRGLGNGRVFLVLDNLIKIFIFLYTNMLNAQGYLI